MLTLAKKLSDLALDIFFPKTCLCCGEVGVFLCLPCQVSLQPAIQSCIYCQKPSLFGFTHPVCKSSQSPEAMYSIWNYHHPPVARMIGTAKYRFLPESFEIYGKLLGQSLIENFGTAFFKEFTLSSIPLHTTRLRWRGFNQSAVIAQSCAQVLQIPYQELLHRTKNTTPQIKLSKEKRKENMSQVFSLIPNPPAIPKKLLLIDDVVTTGSTLLEATRILKKSGVTYIVCVTLARD